MEITVETEEFLHFLPGTVLQLRSQHVELEKTFPVGGLAGGRAGVGGPGSLVFKPCVEFSQRVISCLLRTPVRVVQAGVGTHQLGRRAVPQHDLAERVGPGGRFIL